MYQCTININTTIFKSICCVLKIANFVIRGLPLSCGHLVCPCCLMPQPMGQGGNIHTWPRMFPGSGTSLCHAKQGAPKHVDDLNLMLGSLQWIGPSVTGQGRQCCKDIECVLPVASQFLQRW